MVQACKNTFQLDQLSALLGQLTPGRRQDQAQGLINRRRGEIDARVAQNKTLSWPQEMIRHGAQILSRGNLDVALDNMPAFTAATTIASEA